jgi:hypothetical protein
LLALSASNRHRSDYTLSGQSQPSEQARSYMADWVAFVVYGTIAVLAAVGGLTLEAQALHALQAAAVLVVVAVSAWLAHSMWRVVRARARQAPLPEERSYELHELLRSWPILASGLPGTAVMLLTSAGAWSVATGLSVAQALGVAILFAAGLFTARLAGATTRSRQLVYVLALPTVGAVIVGLEVAAHKI